MSFAGPVPFAEIVHKPPPLPPPKMSVNTSFVPVGDQAGDLMSMSEVCVKIELGGLSPSGATTQSWPSNVNAIFVPSGDHAGLCC